MAISEIVDSYQDSEVRVPRSHQSRRPAWTAANCIMYNISPKKADVKLEDFDLKSKTTL